MRKPQRARAVLGAQLIQRSITRIPRRRFQTLAAFTHHIDLPRREPDTQRLRERMTMRGPRIRVRTQTMMNVQRNHTRWSRTSDCGIEQRGRVETAAERNGDGVIG